MNKAIQISRLDEQYYEKAAEVVEGKDMTVEQSRKLVNAIKGENNGSTENEIEDRSSDSKDMYDHLNKSNDGVGAGSGAKSHRQPIQYIIEGGEKILDNIQRLDTSYKHATTQEKSEAIEILHELHQEIGQVLKEHSEKQVVK